jgi:hypothetical protein
VRKSHELFANGLVEYSPLYLSNNVHNVGLKPKEPYHVRPATVRVRHARLVVVRIKSEIVRERPGGVFDLHAFGQFPPKAWRSAPLWPWGLFPSRGLEREVGENSAEEDPKGDN